jgi:hypothetical protein
MEGGVMSKADAAALEARVEALEDQLETRLTALEGQVDALERAPGVVGSGAGAEAKAAAEYASRSVEDRLLAIETTVGIRPPAPAAPPPVGPDGSLPGSVVLPGQGLPSEQPGIDNVLPPERPNMPGPDDPRVDNVLPDGSESVPASRGDDSVAGDFGQDSVGGDAGQYPDARPSRRR